jgi:hypothetical protein
MPIGLYDELQKLLKALRRSRVPYALRGGLAVAVYGIVRATEDIDLLIQEAGLATVREVAEGLGFRWNPKPLLLKRGEIKIYRLLKKAEAAGSAGQDFLILDLLMTNTETQMAWETRRTRKTEFGPVSVVSPAGLIQLKSLRRSGQDLDDIRKLKRLQNEP